MTKFLLSMLVAFMAIGCVSDTTTDVAPVAGVPESITVSFDDEDSRIELNESLKTVWTSGDKVSVFYKSNANGCWQFNGETGDRSGTLSCLSMGTGNRQSDKVVVVYPYNSDYLFTTDNGFVEAKLPPVQTYKKDSYGVGSSIMIAESDYTQFALKNVCGWLKLQFTGNITVKSISLCGNSEEQVAGGMIINPANALCVLAEASSVAGDDEVGGTLVFEDSILKSVTLDCGEGVALDKDEPTAFYIALPPQNFKTGITVNVTTTSEEVFEQTTSNNITIERNCISPMKSIELTSTFEEEGGVKLINLYSDGADIFVKVPTRVKQQNRRLRWGLTDLATIAHNGKMPIPQMLYMCDYVYPATIIKSDTTLNINPYNAYRRNAQGEIGYYVFGNNTATEVSPDSPEASSGLADILKYYAEPRPGAPLVLYLSEAYYCSPESGLTPTMGFYFDDNGCGWYWFPYDLEGYMSARNADNMVDPNNFWHEGAWWRRFDFTLPAPAKFDGEVTVDISKVKSSERTITLTPDSKTYVYRVGIFKDSNNVATQLGYNEITESYFGGDESLWQWFTTSELGETFGVKEFVASEGAKTIKLGEFINLLQFGEKCHLVVNAMPSKMVDGEVVVDWSKQNFQHIEFTLEEGELVTFAVEWSNQTQMGATATITATDAEMVFGAFTFGESALQEQDFNTGHISTKTPEEYAVEQLTSLASPIGSGGLYLGFYYMSQNGLGLLSEMSNTMNCSLYNSLFGGVEKKMYLAVVGINKQGVDIEACTDSSIQATPIHVFEVASLPQPAVNIAEESIIVDYQSNYTALDCEVVNTIEGGVLSVESDCKWLDAAVSTNGKLYLNCEENPYAKSRKAKVTVAYTYKCSVMMNGESTEVEIPTSTIVTVEQNKNPNVEPLTFTINVKETHYDRIVVDITPSDLNAYYCVGAESQSNYNNYAQQGDAWNLICEYALGGTPNQGTLTNYELSIDTRFANGESDWIYYVYAFQTNENSTVVAGEANYVETPITNDAPAIACPEGFTEGSSGEFVLDVYGKGGEYNVQLNVVNAPADGYALKLYDSNTWSRTDAIVVKTDTFNYATTVFGNEQKVSIENGCLKFTVNDYPADWDKSFDPYAGFTLYLTDAENTTAHKNYTVRVRLHPAK